MGFDVNDPRTQLAIANRSAPAPDAYGPSSYLKFYETAPQIEDAHGRTWVSRGAYFILVYSEASPGAAFIRDGQPDEYMVLIPDPSVTAEVSAGDERVTVPGASVVIVPPGPSTITLPSGGRIVRIFSHLATDLAAQASNAAAYDEPVANVAPYEPWPEPKDGYRVRTYSLDVDPEPGRFGRIWRCTTLMVNYSYPRPGPRDVSRMSPHAHEGFEQGSLVLGGSFVHHLRYPWTIDMRSWQNDEHEICAGPSLAVIPPLAVHTSQQVGREINQLVDIFAPPRADFSEMEGWVLNADEYPLPSELG